jgi:lysophospholipid acyltransferase (LPLAT)-like uncharacterized protein
MMSEAKSTPGIPPAPRPNRKSGVVVPHRPVWWQRFVAAIIYGLIRGVAATLRYRPRAGSEALTEPTSERLIYVVWHNRLALSLILYRRYVVRQKPERRMAAMVSASRDGGLLARILELFQVQPVRGSSSRRGPQALREMVTWADAGYDLAITPDGPRGPCYKVQEGVIATAHLTGLAIVPVSYHVRWKIRLKSWDRFQVPLPFAKIEVAAGKLIRVPREASEADREALRLELERVLMDLSRD